MKMRVTFLRGLILAGLGLLVPLTCQANSEALLAKRLQKLDKLGAFPDDFKAVVHEYVSVEDSIVATKKEEKDLMEKTTGLGQDAVTVQARVEALQKAVAEYDHTDESDFTALQAKMSDAGAKAQDQLMAAQVFVWSYPTSPHFPDAQGYLQQTQKLIADRLQAEKDAEAAKAAAQAKLIQRAQNGDLSLAEWQDFLNNMAQDDVRKYLGPPEQQEGYYWMYTGPRTFDPELNRKMGLRLNFNGGRVVGVATIDTVARASSAPAASSD